MFKIYLVCLLFLFACGVSSDSIATNADIGSSGDGSSLNKEISKIESGKSQQLLVDQEDVSYNVTVIFDTIIIFRADSRKLEKNYRIIRIPDANGTCPSEGFRQIERSGNSFTIEQQNCSGWDYINEKITFQYVESDSSFYLFKFSLEYVDRRYPERTSIERKFTEVDFGKIEFKTVDIDSLYKLNIR